MEKHLEQKINKVKNLSFILATVLSVIVFNIIATVAEEAYDQEAFYRDALSISYTNDKPYKDWQTKCPNFILKSPAMYFQIQKDPTGLSTEYINCFEELSQSYNMYLHNKSMNMVGYNNEHFLMVPYLNIKVRRIYYLGFLKLAFIYIMFLIKNNLDVINRIIITIKKIDLKEVFKKFQFFEKPNFTTVLMFGIIFQTVLTTILLSYQSINHFTRLINGLAFSPKYSQLKDPLAIIDLILVVVLIYVAIKTCLITKKIFHYLNCLKY